MNIHKHMEAIFVVTLAVVGVGNLAFERLTRPASEELLPVARNLATPTEPAVVIVRASREAARNA